MNTITFSANNAIKGYTDAELTPFSLIEDPVSSGGTRTAYISNDINYDIISGANTLLNSYVVLDNILTGFYLSSEDKGITVDISDNRINDLGVGGTANVYLNTYGSPSQLITREFSLAEEDTYDITSFVAGTLGSHCIANVSALISGKTQSNSIQKYLTINNNDIDAPSITLNNSIFTEALDFAATSVLRSGQVDDRYPLALVTARHAIIAKHVAPGIGGRFVFHRGDGTYQTVSVVSKYNTNADLTLVYLDQDITGITPYKIMPTGWESLYAPSVKTPPYFKMLGSLPNIRKAMHSAIDNVWGSYLLINTVLQSSGIMRNTRMTTVQTGEIDDIWGRDGAIGGDSGSPSFLIINDEPVLICSQWTVAMAAALSDHAAELETQMHTLSGDVVGTWAFSYPDLSAFTTY